MKKIIFILCVSTIASLLSACSISKENQIELTSDDFSTSVTTIDIIDETSSTEPSSETSSKSELEENEIKNDDLSDADDYTDTFSISEETDPNVIRPDFKEAMDSYENFFDDYCNFMKKYSENPSDLSLLTDYLDYLTEYTETMDKLDNIDQSEMSDAELKYYLEVMSRINNKLLEIAGQ